MDFAKRAIASVTRKPGKTLILLVIIFILGNIIAGAVSIRQAVTNVQTALHAKMSPVTTINFDRKKYSALLEHHPTLEVEDISTETFEQLGSSSYVNYFDYSALMTILMPPERSSLRGEVEISLGDLLFQDYTFIGVNNPEIVDMKEELVRLVSGRVFNEQEIKSLAYVALVPQKFAEMNNLTIGSTITFEYGSDPETEAIRQYDFEIIGIYEAKTMTEEFKNRLYAPNRVLNEMNEILISDILKRNPNMTEEDYLSARERNKLYYNALFILNEPTDLEAFREEAAALIPEYYAVTAVGSSFEKAEAPLQSIQEIVTLVLYVAVGAAVLIMSLLITLFLRDRRQEIGIYLSLGEKKFKISGQIFVEVAVVALLAITLSLFTGNLLSGTISEQMLIDQMAADQANADQYYFPGDYAYRYQGVTATERLSESYTVSLNTTTVLLFYAIGFATVCVSVLLPIFYITRLNPKKILMGGELEL